jgi:hypothetical protein
LIKMNVVARHPADAASFRQGFSWHAALAELAAWPLLKRGDVMAKKGKVIRLGRQVAKILKNYCREKNIDLKEFLEQAIVEKLEVDRMSQDTELFSYYDASGEDFQIEALEDIPPPEKDNYKRRH